MLFSRKVLTWQDVRKDELRIFSTFDIKKIRRFVNKYDWYYMDRMCTYDDFFIMKMACMAIILQYPYEADIHVLIWAVIWLSSNGCYVPRGK